MDKPLDLWCLLFHICYPFLCQYFCLFRLLQKTIHCFSVDNATHVGAKSSDNFAIITVITKAPCVLALMWVRVGACVCVGVYILSLSCLCPIPRKCRGVFEKYLPCGWQTASQHTINPTNACRILASYPYFVSVHSVFRISYACPLGLPHFPYFSRYSANPYSAAVHSPSLSVSLAPQPGG